MASPEEVGARPELRWRIVGSCFVILLVIVLMRLVLLQVVNHAAAVASVQQNSLRTSVVPASRGQIRDRNGNVLVGNKTSVQLQISLQEATNNPSIKGALSALTGLSVSQINARLANLNYLAYQPEPILTSTPPAMADFVRQHPSEFPGVSLATVTSRYYPSGGALAPHVLGYVSSISQSELAAHPNYQNNSFFGQSGIENFYESVLRGRDGTRQVRVDRLGNVLGTSHIVQPQVGSSVVLNIDEGLQKALDTALTEGINRVRTHVDPRSGRFPPAPNAAAAVMDVRTGAIVALSSYPGYDLNNFNGVLTNKVYKAVLRNGALNNYVTQGQYTPGSTFKMITATAELQKGVMSAGTYVNDTGTFKVPGCLQGNHGCLFHDDEVSGSGLVNLPLALTKSSDYYFYNLGYLFWAHNQRYGETAIQDVAANYGLGQYSLVDLPSESQGRVDSPTVRLALHAAAPKAFPNYQWYTGDNVEMAFGQGSTAVTPISMLDAYATFANGGTRYAPQIAAGIVNPDGRVSLRYGSRVLGHVGLPPAVRDPILQGLIGVINSPSGTAYYPFHQYAKFDLSSYVVAGKTGTASNSHGQEPNSWFVGFGPASSPRYAVICVIGEGGYGADGAAPVVAQAFNYLVKHPLRAVSFAAVRTTTSHSGSTSH